MVKMIFIGALLFFGYSYLNVAQEQQAASDFLLITQSYPTPQPVMLGKMLI
jgi:hypothetical protein